jgi:hypothetical protein
MTFIYKTICTFVGVFSFIPLFTRERPAHLMADEILAEMTPQEIEEFMKD